jgi:hypothetical protein
MSDSFPVELELNPRVEFQFHSGSTQRKGRAMPVERTTDDGEDVTASAAPKRRAARKSRRWSSEELELVVSLKDQGWTAQRIAELLERTDRAIYMILHRMHSAAATSFRCSGCQKVQDAEAFVPSMRFVGGRCRPCMKQNLRNRAE